MSMFKNAPKWAKWHFIDDSGKGFWSNVPVVINQVIGSYLPRYHAPSVAKICASGIDGDANEWHVSLIQKPLSSAIRFIFVKENDKPQWANYHALDGYGRGYWFEKCPIAVFGAGGHWEGGGINHRSMTEIHPTYIKEKFGFNNFSETLEYLGEPT